MAETWKTVRIFISSTFRDMYAERDHLVKVVFPELRERCAKLRLHLVDLDLRWGVTEEEAEQGKVLEIVLDEIDRSRPFFIGIIGERYGSLLDKVPEDVELTYPWLRDYHSHSLTALEIIHGVLRNPEMARRSFFYLRDPEFISHISENKRADFVAENPAAARKLAALKDKIRSSGRPVMESYPCRWDNVRGCIADLDAFGQRVLYDLWMAICAEYPEEALEVDPLAIERQMHEAFAEERLHLHIGRTEQAARLTKYVQGTDRRPIVITGESGCGKSAFLANWYRQYAAQHPDDFVLVCFIGASPGSANHLRLLRNMSQELKRKFALKEEIPQDDRKLSEALAMLLVEASRDKSRIVIVIDALDQLLPLEPAHGLGWLLNYLPEKVRLVVSSLEGDCLDVLRRHGAEEIVLPPLDVDEQRRIVKTLLGEWRRKLDDRQLTALLAHPGVDKPLYLRVALEELRLFGEFERLTARIKDLAEDVPGLFDQVLERLEKDHGTMLVAEAFGLVGCSRYGLGELELLNLLRREGEEQLPRALWTHLARDPSVRAYLVQRGELLGFFHRQLRDAVMKRYLTRDASELVNKHAKLAAHFERAPLERKLDEYPHQLLHAEQWQALARALSDLDLLDCAWNQGREYEWTGYWRSLEGRFDPSLCYKDATRVKEKDEGKTQHVAVLYNRIGRLLELMALYSSALPFFQRLLEIREHALGPNHPDVANSLDDLAIIYQNQGRYAEALPLIQRSLEIREHALGPNHPDVANSLFLLTSFYIHQGMNAEALPLIQRSLEIREHALGPNHPDVANSLSVLAAIYENQGRYAEALPLIQRSLEIREHALGPNHPDVANSLGLLATHNQNQGRYAEALPLIQRSLEIQERGLGPNDPYVASSLVVLAFIYESQGRYAEALPLYQRSLQIRELVFGRRHCHVAYSLYFLANLYQTGGFSAKALPLIKRAVKILGPDNPNAKAYEELFRTIKRARPETNRSQSNYKSSSMKRHALAGRCGVYCGSCGLYRAYKDGGEYMKLVGESLRIPLEKIRCEGCHALTLRCLGARCRIVHCLNSRRFEYCFECPEYKQHSCEEYEKKSELLEARAGIDMRGNLERIKRGEIETWLNESEEKFRCSWCKKPLPALAWNFNRRCYHCGCLVSQNPGDKQAAFSS
jgi:tetratricopeptide (TPR) repeat protein